MEGKYDKMTSSRRRCRFLVGLNFFFAARSVFVVGYQSTLSINRGYQFGVGTRATVAGTHASVIRPGFSCFHQRLDASEKSTFRTRQVFRATRPDKHGSSHSARGDRIARSVATLPTEKETLLELEPPKVKQTAASFFDEKHLFDLEFVEKASSTVGLSNGKKLLNAVLLLASFGWALHTILRVDEGMTRGWTQAEIMMRIPIDNWRTYEFNLDESPVETKTFINVIIYLLGDWLSQTVFKKKDVLDFDAAQTIKNGFIGLCFGPIVHAYYEFSDAILPVEVTINRLYKILMDQSIYLSVKCSIYIVAVKMLNGESFDEAVEAVKGRIKDVMFTAWKFWPLVHCVTYGLIPARHRILWVNCVDLVWNAILALMTREENVEDVVEEMVEDVAVVAEANPLEVASLGDMNGFHAADAAAAAAAVGIKKKDGRLLDEVNAMDQEMVVPEPIIVVEDPLSKVIAVGNLTAVAV